MRDAAAGRTRSIGPLAAGAVLAWCSGWLWPPGGFVVAGWMAVVVLAPRAIRRVRTVRPAGRDPFGEDPATSTPARWLLVTSAGAYWVLVAGAAVSGP
jgi:hypothetical protein